MNFFSKPKRCFNLFDRFQFPAEFLVNIHHGSRRIPGGERNFVIYEFTNSDIVTRIFYANATNEALGKPILNFERLPILANLHEFLGNQKLFFHHIIFEFLDGTRKFNIDALGIWADELASDIIRCSTFGGFRGANEVCDSDLFYVKQSKILNKLLTKGIRFGRFERILFHGNDQCFDNKAYKSVHFGLKYGKKYKNKQNCRIFCCSHCRCYRCYDFKTHLFGIHCGNLTIVEKRRLWKDQVSCIGAAVRLCLDDLNLDNFIMEMQRSTKQYKHMDHLEENHRWEKVQDWFYECFSKAPKDEKLYQINEQIKNCRNRLELFSVSKILLFRSAIYWFRNCEK